MNIQTIPQEIVKPESTSLLSTLPIRVKLGLGYGILVTLAFLGALVSYLGSTQALRHISSASDVRVPVALLASETQADLLRMESDVRGYLALGDPTFKQFYLGSKANFEYDLEELKSTISYLDEESQAELIAIEAAYQLWEPIPTGLFELRDDQFEREPAYQLLTTEGSEYAGEVLLSINTLIELHSQQTPSKENMILMKDMAKFQSNFSAMFSALRSYVNTRNRIYRSEFYINYADNQLTWERLNSALNSMTNDQRALMDTIHHNRQAFLALPDELFTILEDPSGTYREDLYLFTNEALPLANQMRQSLDALVSNQQKALQSDLDDGRQALNMTNIVILVGGLLALLVGIIMAFVSRATIDQPIRRLTSFAHQISSGNLEARPLVASADEIGLLASTFNSMTRQLHQTLSQLRKEKQRADDLLEVVIPIGVDLITERDFNRLLEKMLIEAKTFCNADAGLLLLATEENTLRYVILRIDSQKRSYGGTSGYTIPLDPLPLFTESGLPNHNHLATYIALTGNTINIPNLSSSVDHIANYALSLNQDPALAGYPIHSVLGIPLLSMDRTRREKVIGVVLLLNAQDIENDRSIIPFDPNIQQMMESFSLLAVAALEAYIREQALLAQVAQLRINIDRTAQAKAVEAIVNTDFFSELQSKASFLRSSHENHNLVQ